MSGHMSINVHQLSGHGGSDWHTYGQQVLGENATMRLLLRLAVRKDEAMLTITSTLCVEIW